MKKITIGPDKEFQLLTDALAVAKDNDVVWIDPGQYDLNASIIINKKLHFLVNSSDPLTNKCILRLATTNIYWKFSPFIDFCLFDSIFFEAPSAYFIDNGSLDNTKNINPNFHVIFNRCSFNKLINTGVNYSLFSNVHIGIYDFNYCEFGGGTSASVNLGANPIYDVLVNFRNCLGKVATISSLLTTYNALGRNDLVTTPTIGYGPQYGTSVPANYDQVFQGEVFSKDIPLPSDLYFYEKDTNVLLTKTYADEGGNFSVSYPGVKDKEFRAVSVFPKTLSLFNITSNVNYTHKILYHSDIDPLSFSGTSSITIDLRRPLMVSGLKIHSLYISALNRIKGLKLSYSLDNKTYSTVETILLDDSKSDSNWSSECIASKTIEYSHYFRYLKISPPSSDTGAYYFSGIDIFINQEYYGNPRSMVLDSVKTEEVLRLDDRYDSFYREAVLNDIPIGYWRFNEYSVSDGSVDVIRKHNGNYSGTVKLNNKGCVRSDLDTSAYLNTDGYVVIPYFQTNRPFTLEGFVRSSLLNDTIESPLLFSGDVDHHFIYVYVFERKLIFSSKTNDIEWILVSEPLLKKNRDNYFCITVDTNNIVTMFYNGTMVTQGVCPFDIINNNYPFYFGKKNSIFINGYLDEFAIFPSLLSPEKIYKRYLVTENDIFDYYIKDMLNLGPKQYWRLEEEYITIALNTASAIPTDYIAHYKLDNHYQDESANVFDGFSVNEPQFYVDRWGNSSGSLLFANSLSYFEIPHDILLNRTVFSISLWFRTAGNGTNSQTLISGARTGDLNSLLMYLDNTGTPRLTFNTFQLTGITENLNDNQWHNIILTHSDSLPLTTIYLDGVSVGSSISVMGALFLNNHGLRLGGRPTTEVGGVNETGWNFNGAIDDLRIYDRILTLNEIENIVNDGTEQITGEYGGFVTQGEEGALLYSASKCPLFGGFNGRIEIPGMRFKTPNNGFSAAFWIRSSQDQKNVIYSEYSSNYLDSLILSSQSRLYLETYENGSLVENIHSLSKLNDGIWHLITLVYDETNCSIYVDTHLETRKIISLSDSLATLAYIGCGLSGDLPSKGFVGNIDEFVYFDRVLTDVEIANMYTRANRSIPSEKYLYVETVNSAEPLSHFKINENGEFIDRKNWIDGEVEQMITQASSIQRTDSLFFNNESGHITLHSPDHLFFEGPFSIECWITFHDIDQYTTTNAPQLVDCYERVGNGNSRGYRLGLSMMTNNTLEFIVRDSSVKIPGIIQDQLYHLVAVFDGSQIYCSLNGVVESSNLSDLPLKPLDSDLFIGASNKGFSLNCTFGELVFYDYALSPEEISLHIELGS